MKIDMYQKVPKSFHDQLLDTLEQLPEEKKQKKIITSRRWLVIAAAAVLALGTVSVAAAELFKWNEQAKNRFGVSDEVEDELTMAGVTRPEDTVVEDQGVEFRLVQSVRTNSSCYYLCQVNVPEGIAVDEDTSFGDLYVETAEGDTAEELNGCVADFVFDSLGVEQLFMEIEVFLPEGKDYEGEKVILHISDLVQTEKAEVTGTLLEGEWEIPLTLLGQTESVVYEVNQRVILGEHGLLIKRVQAEPFELRLYVDQEEAQHALMFYPVSVTGIQNRDGSLTEEDFCVNKFGHSDEATGEFYYEATLEQAVDPAKIAGVVFNHGKTEITFLAEAGASGAIPEDTDSREGESKDVGAGTAYQKNNVEIDITVSDAELPENVQALYQKNGYEVVTDGKGLYIHDISCSKMTLVLKLEELDYDQEKGGEIVPFSTTMAYILPYEGSDTAYIYGLAAFEGEHSLSAVPAEEILESEHYQTAREYMLEVRDGTAKNP